MKKSCLFVFVVLGFFLVESIYANEKNKATPDIHIQVSGMDLTQSVGLSGDYYLNSESSVLMYSAAPTRSERPIKKVEWTYNGMTWEGWSFFPYVSENNGSTITLTVTDSTDDYETTTIDLEFADFCEEGTKR